MILFTVGSTDANAYIQLNQTGEHVLSAKKNKFDELLDTKYGQHMDAIKSIRDLTGTVGQLLDSLREKDVFYPIARKFAMLLLETPQSISSLLRAGYLAPAIVVLRWYLEMSQLMWYLWDSPDSRIKWDRGERIRPQEIGKYLEASKLPNWRRHYEDLCNAVHGNYPFIDNYERVAAICHGHEVQPVIIGSVLLFLIHIGQESNWFFVRILQSAAPKAVTDTLYARIQIIEPLRIRLAQEQEASERCLNGKHDDSSNENHDTPAV